MPEYTNETLRNSRQNPVAEIDDDTLTLRINDPDDDTDDNAPYQVRLYRNCSSKY